MLRKPRGFLVVNFPRGRFLVLLLRRRLTFRRHRRGLRFGNSHRIPHPGATQFPKFLPHRMFIFIGAQVPQRRRTLATHFSKIRTRIFDGRDRLPDRREGHIIVH